jgi:fatty-acyl-CoA synthase
VRLRIVDPDTGQELDADGVGELLVRGYTASEYLGADAASNDVFLPDGWYRTGDLGSLDDEGCFHFFARATEMIKTSGINVAPGEVEELLKMHEDVLSAAVVGVEDEDKGEVVVAFTVLAPDAAVTPDVLRSWCKQRVAGFKVPARIHLIDELPKTDTGKVARRLLPELDAELLGRVG